MPPVGRSASLSGPGEKKSEESKLDAAVVAGLYVAHGDELRRFLVGMVGDASLAADVLQTTFARLMEKGHETREENRKGWLFSVAYHEAMAVRRRQAAGNKMIRQASWLSNGECETSDDSLVRFETVEAVREALTALRPEERQIVRMRIYEGKTFPEIVEELGIPLGTALGRMRTALLQLKQRLKRHGEEKS